MMLWYGIVGGDATLHPASEIENINDRWTTRRNSFVTRPSVSLSKAHLSLAACHQPHMTSLHRRRPQLNTTSNRDFGAHSRSHFM